MHTGVPDAIRPRAMPRRVSFESGFRSRLPPTGWPHGDAGRFQVGRRGFAANLCSLSMRLSDQPSWPRARTCCFSSSVRHSPPEGKPSATVNVLDQLSRWPVCRGRSTLPGWHFSAASRSAYCTSGCQSGWYGTNYIRQIGHSRIQLNQDSERRGGFPLSSGSTAPFFTAGWSPAFLLARRSSFALRRNAWLREVGGLRPRMHREAGPALQGIFL